METGELAKRERAVRRPPAKGDGPAKGGKLARTPMQDPGVEFRDRLIATLDAAMVPKDARLAHLSALTGRVPQTSRRWIDPVKPGLPDLESFALLCKGLQSDANWLLGLSAMDRVDSPECTAERSEELTGSGVRETSAWIAPMVQELAEEVMGCAPMKMPGDDMEPIIQDGDTVFVDFEIQEIVGNGIYVVECDGRVMVRNVERRIGEGLVLSCANQKYKACLVKNTAATQRLGLKVLGKVRGCISVSKFCRAN
jgi:hypothetical protein